MATLYLMAEIGFYIDATLAFGQILISAAVLLKALDVTTLPARLRPQ